ncbi:mediator of RNA polymerase II transcription subunit 10 isoform X3 [Microplitis demolitor]|uniref:mediator of RNA polymerase II transcription subunit 10 isoform X3 n=1 Tax=Microplitis demolitor TaxID=69319 RepID=UPI0004CD2965|nr:mediator of RNA polymerase II transcription subunit 10 isoform X3 [Microplitis demolitor]
MAEPTLKALEEHIEKLVENVRQLNIMVCDFQPQGQTALNHKIQGLVSGLQEIDKLKSRVPDVIIPLEVFDYIDKGKNPKIYTKDVMDKAFNKNLQVGGQIDQYKKLKANLLVEATHFFPKEMARYRATRSDFK